MPTYQSILWRDGTVETLAPTGIQAVRVPGQKRPLYMDEKGRVRCPHGFCDVTLREQQKVSQERAGAILRGWAALPHGHVGTGKSVGRVEAVF